MENRWKSQIGFIWASAGAAIGLGNLWRFPTIVANNGGSAFLLAYVVLILAIGIPAVMAEMALGRHTGSGPLRAFAKLAPSTRWYLVGYVTAAGNALVLSYYAVIAGTALAFAFKYLAGMAVAGTATAPVPPGAPLLAPAATVAAFALFLGTVVVISLLGVQRGVERVASAVIPSILIVLALLVARIFLLERALEGAAWLLAPRWHDVGMDTFFAALGQVFYSLSLGFGALITYAGYLDRDRSDLPRSAVLVAAADTSVGMLAALMIIPALFAFDMPLVPGPDLVFRALTRIFAQIPFGQGAGFIFFALLATAGLTSSLSMLEVPVAALVQRWGWPRRRAVLATGAAVFLLGIPSALSFAGVETATLFGRPFLDAMDFSLSNLVLPATGILVVIFVGWVWGADKAREELTRGAAGFKSAPLWQWAIRYAVPVAIAIVLVTQFTP